MSPMRPELSSLLESLRAKIRNYVLIEGSAIVLASLGVLFWLSFGIDHAWFWMSSLELPVWFRAGFDVAVVAAMTFLLMTWIGLRMARGFRARALALVLEKRFPELNDRLITAVEFAESQSDPGTELGGAMLNRTVEDVVKAAQKLDVTSVFDRGPMRKAVTSAAVLAASIIGLGVANQEALATWRDSFLSLQNEYWNRESDLTIHVVAQPGDIVRDFKDNSYKHARGSDLTILLKSKDGSKVPERVQLAYRMSGGGRGTVLCSKLGDEFRHTITSVLEDLEFRVYGGDFVTRNPYQIHVVDPPQLKKIELACNYPAYTGRRHPDWTEKNPLRDIVQVRGTQVAVPAETEFLLQGHCNKPLANTRIQFGNIELVVARTNGTVSAEIVERTEEGELVAKKTLDAGRVARWISSDGKQITIPYVLSNQESDVATTRIEKLTTDFGHPFVIAPDTQIRIFLEDTDEILTSEPARVLVNGVLDTPPLVETKLRGIGTSITRKASIPILGRISDDYGISGLKFEYQVNDEEWKTVELEAPPVDDEDGIPIREFVLKRNDEEEYERFKVIDHDLSLGQKLTVCVVATDGDDLNGPHQTRGERYAFKIVSNEELLSVLYQRELNLRRQFEQILTEARKTQTDLILHRSKADERKRALAADGELDDAARAKIADNSAAIVACAERSLHQVRKNANETASIELGFRDIREELVNNGLHTPQTLERMDDRIVKPLHSIGTDDYPAVDQAIGLFRLANERKQDPISTIDASAEAISVLISHMERVLIEMRKLETFQEALEQLKAIIGHQEALREKAAKEGKKELLKDLLK
jgi:hypothetical protein